MISWLSAFGWNRASIALSAEDKWRDALIHKDCGSIQVELTGTDAARSPCPPSVRVVLKGVIVAGNDTRWSNEPGPIVGSLLVLLRSAPDVHATGCCNSEACVFAVSDKVLGFPLPAGTRMLATPELNI